MNNPLTHIFVLYGGSVLWSFVSQGGRYGIPRNRLAEEREYLVMKKPIKQMILAGGLAFGVVSVAQSTPIPVPTMTLRVFEGKPGSLALVSGPAIPSVSPTTSGDISFTFSNADFSAISVSALAFPMLDQPNFSLGSITMSSKSFTTPREVKIEVSVTNLAAIPFGGDLMTSSAVNFPISKGVTSVGESVYYDTTNTAFGTAHLINTDTFLASGVAASYHFVSNLSSTTFSETWIIDAIFSGAGKALTLFPSAELDFIPEPASIALLGAGLVGLGMVRRRKAA